MNEIEAFKTQVANIVPPKADVKVGKINYDLETFKKLIEELKTKILSVGITITTIDEFKSLKAKLNNVSKAINEEKKRVKKDYNAVYTEYEDKAKECKAIVDETSEYVNEQLQIFERQFHQDQKEKFEGMWSQFGKEKEIPFIRIEKEEWYLKKYSDKKVLVEMTELNERINKDIETITRSIDNEPERNAVIKNYYGSLDAANELGDYYRWKNTIKNEPVIVEKIVETTTPKIDEKPVEAKIKAENKETKETSLFDMADEIVTPQEVKIKEPQGETYTAVFMITAKESVIEDTKKFFDENKIDYVVRVNK